MNKYKISFFQDGQFSSTFRNARSESEAIDLLIKDNPGFDLQNVGDISLVASVGSVLENEDIVRSISFTRLQIPFKDILFTTFKIGVSIFLVYLLFFILQLIITGVFGVALFSVAM